MYLAQSQVATRREVLLGKEDLPDAIHASRKDQHAEDPQPMKKKATARSAKATSRQSTLNFATSSEADLVAESSAAVTSTKSGAKNRGKRTADFADRPNNPHCDSSAISAQSAVKTQTRNSTNSMPSDPTELPKPWHWGTLGDILKSIDTGKSFRCEERPPNSDETGVIKVSAVTWGTYDESESKTCVDASRINEQYLVNQGDFLFSRANTIQLIGACVIADNVTHRMMLSDKILRFRFKSDILPKWALYWLRSTRGHREIQRLSTGNQESMRNIGQDRIRQIQIPLAPLPEQHRIVAEIEKQFTRLDAGVAALKRVQANLKRYRAAVLKAACEGKLVPSDDNWENLRLGDLIDSMDQGWSPKCEGEPSESHSSWAVIKTTAIQPLRFLEEENKRLPPTMTPRPKLEIHQGDLLVTRAGPRNRVGVACLVRSSRPRLMLCDKAYRLRCKWTVVNPAFLELALNAPHIAEEVNQLKTGISDSGVNLTQKRFEKLIIQIPSLVEQSRIVAEVERRLSMVQNLEAVLVADLRRSIQLRDSILKRAFIGELS